MGLYRLFAGLVGYDPLVLEISVGSRNASLGYEQAELLRQVNVALGDRLTDLRGQYRPVVRRLLINADGPLRKHEGLSLGLPTGHVEWVRAESMAMLEELRGRPPHPGRPRRPDAAGERTHDGRRRRQRHHRPGGRTDPRRRRGQR